MASNGLDHLSGNADDWGVWVLLSAKSNRAAKAPPEIIFWKAELEYKTNGENQSEVAPNIKSFEVGQFVLHCTVV